MRCTLAALAALAGLASYGGTVVDAAGLKCPRNRKPRTLTFDKGSDYYFPVSNFGGLTFDNWYFDMPSPVPYGPPVIEDSCGYLTAGTYAIFNSAGAPASITAPLRKCKWQPLSIRVNAAWWDNLQVYFYGQDASGEVTGTVEAVVNTSSISTVDLTPLGTVSQFYIETELTSSSARPARADCQIEGRNRTQIVVSQFTYQAVKGVDKSATQMYIKSAGNMHPGWYAK